MSLHGLVAYADEQNRRNRVLEIVRGGAASTGKTRNGASGSGEGSLHTRAKPCPANSAISLKQAVMDGLIPRNVTEAVKSPKVMREEVRPLSQNEAKKLLTAAHGDRMEALYNRGPSHGPASG
jgi:hypothetical protein